MKRRFTFSTLDSNANDRYWDVYLDSRLLEGCRATGEDGLFTMYVDSLESWDRLKPLPCDQFRQFEQIYAPAPKSFAPFVLGHQIRLYASPSIGLVRIVVQLQIDAGEWTNQWSINRFLESMESAVNDRSDGSQWMEYGGYSRYSLGFDFVIPIVEQSGTLGDVTGTATSLVRATVQSVSAKLQGSASVQVSTAAVAASAALFGAAVSRVQGSTKGTPSRGLVVFLCHASEDKKSARELYAHLLQDGFDPWLDEFNLLPGQEWETEIPRAVRKADVVVVCLSGHSIDKTGYVQREIRIALDAAEERPQGTIFVVPARIEDCQVPERLSRWQRVDLFAKGGYERLSLSLDAVRIESAERSAAKNTRNA